VISRSEAKEFTRQAKDYIPGGAIVKEPDKLVWRRLEDHEEVSFCCVQTGYDLQSGPMYCGAVADWRGDQGGLDSTFACDNHHYKVVNKVPAPSSRDKWEYYGRW
jgi:hypothetical protein